MPFDLQEGSINIAQGGQADKSMFKAAGEISSDSDEDYSEITGSELDEEITWIEWFCHLKGNEFFVEVDEDYIQDDFNLTGLAAQVPYYEHALNMILDFDDQDDGLTEDQQPLVETAAQMLYGLIHARFILTSRGMAAMLDKYNSSVYGTCPLMQCEGLNQSVLPIGMSDLLRQSAAKVYCPHCREIYFPRSSRLECLDGAYFGTSFAHLFFLTYQHLVPPSKPLPYEPRIYGFRIHKNFKESQRRQRAANQKAASTASTHTLRAPGAGEGADLDMSQAPNRQSTLASADLKDTAARDEILAD